MRKIAVSVAGLLCLLGGSAEAMPVAQTQTPVLLERAAVVTTVVRRGVVRRPAIVRRPGVIVRRRVIVR